MEAALKPLPNVIDESLLPPRGIDQWESRRSLGRLAYYEAWAWFQAALYWIPGRLGWIMRRIAYAPFFQRAGKHWHFAEFTSVQPPNRLQIGNYVAVSRYAQINALGGVIIGDYSGVGPFTQILSVSHNFVNDPNSKVDFGAQARILETAPVIVEPNVWIGAGCVILPGVRIGPNAVVAGGSTVHKDVPPYSIVGGVPARVLRRSSPEELAKEGNLVLRSLIQRGEKAPGEVGDSN